MRSLPPSTTFEYTFTVSPGRNAGTFGFSCSFWIRSMTFMTAFWDRMRTNRDGRPEAATTRRYYHERGPRSRQRGRVGAARGGPVAGALPAPLGDTSVVPGEQHLGGRDPAEDGRPREGRVIELLRAGGERLGRARVGGDRSVDEPDRRIEEGQRGDLPAGQHERAERDLVDRIERGQPLVYPFVVTADDHE